MKDPADEFFWFMLDLVTFHPEGVGPDHEHDIELARLGTEAGYLENLDDQTLRPTDKGRIFVEQSRRSYRV